ncbi:MAG TPA: YncE family protein, partial [Gemmatales bacterium]|nr:YncE family protein [Gemmatales bacterium]
MYQGCFSFVLLLASVTGCLLAAPAVDLRKNNVDRSPVDCVLSPDEQYIYTVNQTSGTVSVVHLKSKAVLQEVEVDKRPTHAAITTDGKYLLVTATFSHELYKFTIRSDGQLHAPEKLWLGFEPRGIVLDANNQHAIVALSTSHEVVWVDLHSMQVVSRVSTGRWPRSLALSADGKTLIAACSGDGLISIIDVESRTKRRDEPFAGLNQGQVVISKDGNFAFTPYIYHFGSAPTE